MLNGHSNPYIESTTVLSDIIIYNIMASPYKVRSNHSLLYSYAITSYGERERTKKSGQDQCIILLVQS